MSLQQSDQQPKLAKLFAKGSRKAVEKALESTGHGVNDIVNSGTSPFRPYLWPGLLHACRNLNVDVVKLLLEKGADPDFCASGNVTPMVAVMMGIQTNNQSTGVECAKLLVDAGACIAPLYNKRTLLTHTVQNNLPIVAEYLLEVGVDPNQRDCYGVTALNFATEKNLQIIVEILRKHETNPYVVNLNGKSCLDIAEDLGNVELKETLTAWRKDYFLTKFNKDKDKFITMVKEVNAGCNLYTPKKRSPDKGNKSGQEAEKDENQAANTPVIAPPLPFTLVKRKQEGKQNAQSTEETEMSPSKLYLKTTEAINIVRGRQADGNGGEIEFYIEEPESPPHDLEDYAPLLDEDTTESSQRSSPPPSPTEFNANLDVDSTAEKTNMRERLMLILGTAVVTILACQLFRKFKASN